MCNKNNNHFFPRCCSALAGSHAPLLCLFLVLFCCSIGFVDCVAGAAAFTESGRASANIFDADDDDNVSPVVAVREATATAEEYRFSLTEYHTQFQQHHHRRRRLQFSQQEAANVSAAPQHYSTSSAAVPAVSGWIPAFNKTTIWQIIYDLMRQNNPLNITPAEVQRCHPPRDARDFASCSIKYESYRCSATQSVKAPCPTNCNVSCPAGFYCPILPFATPDNLTIMFPCPNGGVCPERTSCVWACPRGYYCENGAMPKRCPRGHYCRSGTSVPVGCTFFDFCGNREGLHQPRAEIFGIIVVASCTVLCVIIIFVSNYRIEASQLKKQIDLILKHKSYKMADTLAKPLPSLLDSRDSREGINTSSSQLRTYGAFQAQQVSSAEDTLSSVDERADESETAPLASASYCGIQVSHGRSDSLNNLRNLSPSAHPLIDYVCNEAHMELKGPNAFRRLVNCMFCIAYEPQTILESVSCVIRPKTVTAIMGPSGAGKTSLMNVLSGKASSYASVRGRCEMSGRPLTSKLIDDMQHFIGFVPQDDVMPRQCTVNENLGFQAKARLPPQTGMDSIRIRVAACTDALGLGKISASRIGDENVRGISGGQRKRVNIGMEVVTAPSVLFLDEPTSGLDASTSLVVCDFLKDLADICSTTIISVVHQPRYEIFKKFDNLILLAPGGKVVYSGPMSEVRDFFQSYGYIVPPNCNPADFYMDVIAADSQIVSAKKGMTVQNLIDESKRRFDAENASYVPQHFSEEFIAQRERTSHMAQFIMYLARNMRLFYVRRPARLLLEALICCGGACLLSFALPSRTFFQVSAQYALGGLLFVLFTHFAALPTFGPEHTIAMRELNSGFKKFAYFMGKDVASFPKVLYLPVLFSLQYTIIAPNVMYNEYLLVFLSMAYASFGSGILLSASLNEATAQMAAVLASFTYLLFSGYNPDLDTIWAGAPCKIVGEIATGISPIRWALDALLATEFERSTEFWRLCTNFAIYKSGFNADVLLYVKCVIMLGLGVVFRAVAFLVFCRTTRL